MAKMKLHYKIDCMITLRHLRSKQFRLVRSARDDLFVTQNKSEPYIQTGT